MAVDSAQKRVSVISFARMSYGQRVPAATNLDTDEDRGQAIFLYAGMDVGGGSPPAPANDDKRKFRWFRRRHR